MSAFNYAIFTAVPVEYGSQADQMMEVTGYCNQGDRPHQIPLSVKGSDLVTYLSWWAFSREDNAVLMSSESPPDFDWGNLSLEDVSVVWDSRIVKVIKAPDEPSWSLASQVVSWLDELNLKKTIS